MNASRHSTAIGPAELSASRASPRPPLAARSVFSMLRRLDRGHLELRLPDGALLHFGDHAMSTPTASATVHDWGVFARLLRRGDIGLAEGYFRGQWSTPDLPGLLRLLLANRAAVERALYGSKLGTLLDRLRHIVFRRNTRAGSRDNIHAHYDIGNDFYQLWLDPGMTYSAALYERPEMTLEQAQTAKLQRVLRELRANPGERVLEIGCGWGSFAEAAAGAGLEVDGITLSQQQLEYAQARLRQAGLDPRARLHRLDYRDAAAIAPPEGYAAIASIEMFEAVGEAHWPAYFSTVAALLRPGGRACIQTITIDDALFPRYRRGTDFIQRYIFPGGMLPSKRAFAEHARRAGLRIVATHEFGTDYARTLALWRARFIEAIDRVRELGFDRRFERLWEFYLGYCEAGFAAGTIDVVQYTLVKDPCSTDPVHVDTKVAP
ncbi:cyclopropane-fatty-acyl-phospholipid synthase [mine drainage metagenome]|uniref:Cyclopropane-fatty-acyl-phospholipid synthase n=1 Tax=mine drainage metagenome TaxID=410659 RepID=A0A1J5QGR3_9ZZZZ